MADPMTKIDTSPEALEIERDETIAREYIPLPGGWEVQTKGGGSTLRLLDKKSGERHPMPFGESFMVEFFERFAREVNAACSAIAAEKRAGPAYADWEELARWHGLRANLIRNLIEDFKAAERPKDFIEKYEANANFHTDAATLLRQPSDTAAAFLAGAKAMQEAAVTVCSHFDTKSPYIGQAKHVEIAIRAIDPAALTERPVAPVVADGWNYDMSAAPSDESVIISTTGGWIGEAMLIWCGEVWSWCWAGTLQPLHHNHKPTAWHHLPAPPAKQELGK